MSTSNPADSWYSLVPPHNGDLRQGDFFFGCPVALPRCYSSQAEAVADIDKIDIVVMSQSCDLEHTKVEFAVVCPVKSLSRLMELYPDTFNQKSVRDALQKDMQPGYCLLDGIDILPSQRQGPLVVDFHRTLCVHVQQLRDEALALDARVRLTPPYRERLSQAFAKYYMRVALPAPISGL